MSDDVKQPKKGFRWSRLVLVVSLALNLLVLGIVGGAVLGRGHPDRPPRIDLLSFGPYASALDEQDRAALKKELFGEHKILRETRRGLRRDLDEVVVAVRATPFDPDRVSTAMAAPNIRITRQIELVQARVLDMITQMNDAERAAYADRLEDAVRKGPSGRPKSPPREPTTDGAY